MPNPDQLLLRNICVSALKATKEFAHRRAEVAIVDEATISVKLFNARQGGTSETFTIVVGLPNH